MWECRPSSSQPLRRSDLLDGLERVAAGDREPELLVLVGGGDVLVRVRLDAGGHPHHHLDGAAEVLGDLGEPLDLGEAVEDDPAHARVHGTAQLGVRLVVAVVADPARVEAGAQGDGELARGAHVEAEALLGDPLRDRRAQERLAGVEDVERGERVAERPGPGPQVHLVEHVRRGVELGDQVGHRHPADGQVTVDLVRRRGPQARHQLVGVVRLAQPGGALEGAVGVRPSGFVGGHRGDYIRSGAETPSRPRPLARTVRVAATSSSRARCRSVGSSSPIGSTRQLS